ncbi:MAG: hypothetical protein NC238_02035 [Dehalobacter sp.]|jgi:hypothetical protein|nr:hypothetical protein [Dehalobacter sp.]
MDVTPEDDGSIVTGFQKGLGNLPWNNIDALFVENDAVRRTLIGYCFETSFKKLMSANGYDSKPGSGDDIVDLIVNGHTLQLKTQHLRETIEGVQIGYRFHKTHGKERFPDALYTPGEFADFLVGLCPDKNIIICPKDALQIHQDYPDRFQDPQRFTWENEWINRFDLIDVDVRTQLADLTHDNALLPRTGEMVSLSDIEIINTILEPANFRLYRQNIKGALREIVCKQELERRDITLLPPGVSTFSCHSKVKVDGYLPDGRSVQIKGITQRISNGKKLGVEIKGSHGRIPKRLYTPDAFDLLIVVIDPGSIKNGPTGIDPDAFNYYIIETNDLPHHERSAEWGEPRLKDIFKFDCGQVTLNNFDILN